MKQPTIATVTHRWPNGEATIVEVSCEPNFPDAVDQCRTQATKLFHDAMAYVVAIDRIDATEPTE
jgi:hypothetical protein